MSFVLTEYSTQYVLSKNLIQLRSIFVYIPGFHCSFIRHAGGSIQHILKAVIIRLAILAQTCTGNVSVVSAAVAGAPASAAGTAGILRVGRIRTFGSGEDHTQHDDQSQQDNADHYDKGFSAFLFDKNHGVLIPHLQSIL